MSHTKAISCLIAVSLLLASIVPCYAYSSIIKPDAAYADSFVHEQINVTLPLEVSNGPIFDGGDASEFSSTELRDSPSGGDGWSSGSDNPIGYSSSGYGIAYDSSFSDSSFGSSGTDPDLLPRAVSDDAQIAQSDEDRIVAYTGSTDGGLTGGGSSQGPGFSGGYGSPILGVDVWNNDGGRSDWGDSEDNLFSTQLYSGLTTHFLWLLYNRLGHGLFSDDGDSWLSLIEVNTRSLLNSFDIFASRGMQNVSSTSDNLDPDTFHFQVVDASGDVITWNVKRSSNNIVWLLSWLTHVASATLVNISSNTRSAASTLQTIWLEQVKYGEGIISEFRVLQDLVNALYNEDGYLSAITKNQATAANQLLQGMNNYTGIITGYLSTLIDNQGVINSNMLLGLNGIENQLGFAGTIDGVASFRMLFLSQTGSLISLLQDMYYDQESGFDLTIELLYDIIDALANLSPGNITVDNASVVTAVNNLLNQFLNTGSINGIPTFTHRMQTWVQTIVDAILSTDGNGELIVDGTPIVTAINQLWNQLGSSSTIDGVDTFRKAYDQNALYGQTALAKLISILGDESKTTVTVPGEVFDYQPAYIYEHPDYDGLIQDYYSDGSIYSDYLLAVDEGTLDPNAFPIHGTNENLLVSDAALTINFYTDDGSFDRSFEYPLGQDGSVRFPGLSWVTFDCDYYSNEPMISNLYIALEPTFDSRSDYLFQHRIGFVVAMNLQNAFGETTSISTMEYFFGDPIPSLETIDTSTTVTKQMTVLGMLADLLEAIRKIQSSSSSTVVPNIDLTIDTSALEGKLDTIIGLMALSGVEDLLDDFIGDFDLDTSSLLVGQIQAAVQNAFPFCIPAILKQVLGLLDAPASIAPVDLDLFGAELHLDFEAFGIIAFGDVTKWICRIGFCVVLLVNTRRFIFTLNGGASDG